MSQDNFCTGIFELVLDLRYCIDRIGPAEDSARAHDALVCNRHKYMIRRNNHDHFSFPYSESIQTKAQPTHPG